MIRLPFERGLFAGFLGAFVVSAALTVGRALGLPVHLEMLLGAIVTQGTGPAAWVVGLLLFLGAGALLGVLYGLACRAWHPRGSAVAGLLLAVPHTLVAGALLAVMPPAALPVTLPAPAAEALARPGPFLSALGPLGVAVFVGVHLVFGAVVGWLLGREPSRAAGAQHRLRWPVPNQGNAAPSRPPGGSSPPRRV